MSLLNFYIYTIRNLLEKIKATIIDPLYNGIISIIVTPINKLIKILIGFKNKIIETLASIIIDLNQ